MNNPFRIKALVVYDGIDEENATARALRALKRDLEESDVVVEVSQCICDAELIVTSDPTVQCALVYLDGAGDEKHRRIQHFLELLRSRSHDMPVFLMSNRTRASEIPAAILDKVNDFIWILEDTSDFISGRILAAIQRYREFILPPMFKALAEFSDVYEYSWHTPGHTGGTAFLKSPVGRAFSTFQGTGFPFRSVDFGWRTRFIA